MYKSLWTLLGRVVKFIGDEVMWVSTTPELLAKAAVDLVDHPKAREAQMQVRAGLDYGTVLAMGGDYFGNTVNLAARLVAAAEPGQILATAAVRDGFDCDVLPLGLSEPTDKDNSHGLARLPLRRRAGWGVDDRVDNARPHLRIVELLRDACASANPNLFCRPQWG